ncbi:DUF2812 domain-containing protein [Gorillibacterium massiliense]|uniref:DUF2812 domain-containing protein n=1 Tax=Gorillibacterium massiliense TaxID=1280390 RepID=UPI000592BB82|nr:DUF2812 domain-containing protein [Gorillibacterium massiliense]
MRKFKFFIDFAKEEKWLNEMARQGYQLENAFFGYQFRSAPPEDANIKIDYRTFKHSADFADYCAMFEDCGWMHIAGSKNSGSHYFKKMDGNGLEDIFSDSASKAGRYKRIGDMWMTLAICFLPLFIVMVNNNMIDVHAMLHPKLLYYTPGLWEKSGSSFWGAFLFETPFAILRGFMWLIYPILIIYYAFCSWKVRRLYRNTKRTGS